MVDGSKSIRAHVGVENRVCFIGPEVKVSSAGQRLSELRGRPRLYIQM